MTILGEMREETGIGSAELLRIVDSAPSRYKVYTIPKRQGGVRTIAQPSRELKVLQRFLISRLLIRYPIHPCAMAYVEGRNIRENARRHMQGRVLLKLDFREFFPSIVVQDWLRYFQKYPLDLDEGDAGILSRILFWGKGTDKPVCLSIGAPSSPILSNILMYQFDERVSAAMGDLGVSYTRYADDITVSADNNERLLEAERAVRRIVTATNSPKLSFNDTKRGMYTKGERRMVTGLILTPQEQVSIGRPRKRMISSLVHKYTLGQLTLERVGELKGYLAFAKANEPIFLQSMIRKYGKPTIERILRTHIPGRNDPRRAPAKS